MPSFNSSDRARTSAVKPGMRVRLANNETNLSGEYEVQEAVVELPFDKISSFASLSQFVENPGSPAAERQPDPGASEASKYERR